MSLFPLIEPQSTEAVPKLGLYKEIKWDFINNVPVFANGAPVIVTGKEAVSVWVWKTLHTPRYRYEIYTWDYGCEMESLIGQPYTDELKQSEATRYIKECLLTNPYIVGVNNVTVIFTEDVLTISCSIETIYGEVEINV